MKKFLKITGIILFVFVALLVTVSYVLESKIEAIVQKYADENLNAEVHFDKISLSLLSSFPSAEVYISNLKINTLAPFEDDTLASAKTLSFEMPMSSVFKDSGAPLIIKEIFADELLLVIKTNEKGAVNYNIVKPSDKSVATDTSSSSGGLKFDIQKYELRNSAFTYIDDMSQVVFYLTEINHEGKGLFSDEISQLDTNTFANVSLSMDGTTYLSNNSIKLKALIDLDLDQQKYIFKENKGFINGLPLEFDGFVQMVDAGQQMDISFKNPESSFKDFLAIIPNTFTKSIEDVNTTGNFTIVGTVKGLLSEDTIPTLDINMQSKNASFQYPNLPKGVDNIYIDASVKNITGRTDDTFIDINQLDFKIDNDVFKSEVHLKNLTENMLVSAKLDGVLNLANLTKAYPVTLANELSGILKGQLNTSFDMAAIETNAYERIKNNGRVSISDVIFSSDAMPNSVRIKGADLAFNTSKVTLNSFEGSTGQSDFLASGSITNLMGFLLSDKDLKGNFNLSSNTFALADFMTAETSDKSGTNESEETKNKEVIKIPAFLDCSITAKAKTVLYDNVALKNVSGELVIKDENAQLKNMTSDLFQGQIGISGNVSTKEERPKFYMQLAMQQFDISESFKTLDMLSAILPIGKVLQGKLNSTIDVSGYLNEDFAPDLATISGKALAEIFTKKIDAKNSPLLSSLDGKLNFIDLKALDLNDLKTNLSFENGQVSVKPFTVNYKDIPIEISGTHGFSKTMNYAVVMQVPAKYLGADINRLIGKINDNDINNISIPVTAAIGGTFTSPTVSTDLTSGVSNLTTQLIEIEKQKLIGKGKDKATNLLSGLLGGAAQNTKTDSTNTENNSGKMNTQDKVKEGVKSALGGLLNRKKTPKVKTSQDSIKN